MSAQELRRAAETLRSPHRCNTPVYESALADWLDEVAENFQENTLEDSIDCPSCGTACAGHPTGLWHDACGGAIEDDYYDQDPCECYTKPLRLARLINGGAL